MSFCQAFEKLSATGTILLVSGLAVPGLADSQASAITSAETEPVTVQSLRAYRDVVRQRQNAIAREESQNGPHSITLIDRWLALGRLHQEQEEHDLAIESFERALQIRRFNDGLQSIEQAPLLRQLIVSEKARGNGRAVLALEQRLLDLARRNLDDVRSVPILHETADGQLNIYQRYVNGELPPVININVDADSRFPDRMKSSNRYRALWNIKEARRNYSAAIRVLLRDELYRNDELLELEEKLLGAYYLEATSGYVSPPRGDHLYRLGIESHRRLAVCKTMRSRNPEDFAHALVELGDWHLLFSHHRQAFETYREAYELFVEQGVPPDRIETILSPEVPVLLPVFASDSSSSEDGNAPEEFIEVSFELSRYGRGRDPEVIAHAATSHEELERQLKRLIYGNRFRPRIVNGKFSPPSRYFVRYYGGEQLTAAR